MLFIKNQHRFAVVLINEEKYLYLQKSVLLYTVLAHPLRKN